MRFRSAVRSTFVPLLFALALSGVPAARAQDNPFAGGWVLKSDGSTLGFQSVKNDTKVEQNNFATLTGTISDNGDAEVHVSLDSIDTGIDLRNVRMRFLFFETFKFPDAVVTAHIDAAMLADLPTKRRITLKMPYTLDLHGVKLQQTADIIVTLISDNLVDLASVGTIPIAAQDFGMTEGVTKLEEAAKVKIVPTGSVTFDWLFERAAGTATPAATETTAPAKPASTAMETTGNFDTEACLGRFEILSNAGNINFSPASARLDVAGSAILDNLYDIISRCPGMALEIGGHTDSDGSDATNQALSEKRAAAVIAYLVAKGIPSDRLTAHGYGETRPLVANDTAENRARNRRIEFKVLK
ncbi:MAG: OmpA family protein [bacterium]